MIEVDYSDILEEIVDASRYEISNIKPSDWAEQNRMMTSDISPVPGMLSYQNSPYTKEIVDCLAPDHPARVVAVMKGSQIGFSTTVIEAGIGWIISQAPGNILFLVGHEDLVSDAGKKIDRMIDNSGIRHLIRATTQRARNTKSGDTDKIKEFPNGYLKMGIANHKMLRNISMQYGFIDDFESMKGSTAQSGATTEMIEQRFAAYARKMKLFYISTPELKQSSNIEPVYLLGDQRKYFIPCPCCGEFIHIGWEVPMKDNPEKMGGMTWKTEDGKLIDDSVGYICQICGGFFDDKNKTNWIRQGKWMPTATPSKDGYYSYHISSLYAPTYMFGWEHYVRKYLEANPVGGAQNEAKMKTFKNLVLGETFEEKGEEPTANQLQKNIRQYEIDTLPEKMSERDGNGKIVLLTLGADLNGVVDDARLDYEVVAWTETGSTYSVRHGSIGTFIPREGMRKHKEDRYKWTYEHGSERSVWPELDRVFEKVFVTDTGRKMKVFCSGIDVGHYDSYAWQYIDNANTTIFGVKGDGVERVKQLDRNVAPYKIGKARPNLYLVDVNMLKDELAERMKLNFNPRIHDKQPVGFMNFPIPSAGLYLYENFFAHYESEHRVPERKQDGTIIGTRWVKKTSVIQNHLFDCAIYNMAVRRIFIDLLFKELKVKNGDWQDYCDIVLKRK